MGCIRGLGGIGGHNSQPLACFVLTGLRRKLPEETENDVENQEEQEGEEGTSVDSKNQHLDACGDTFEFQVFPKFQGPMKDVKAKAHVPQLH